MQLSPALFSSPGLTPTSRYYNSCQIGPYNIPTCIYNVCAGVKVAFTVLLLVLFQLKVMKIFQVTGGLKLEVCLNEKCINDSAKNMMVRSLVNLLFAKDTKPSRANCENLARRLILKYPFLKDDMGNGTPHNLIGRVEGRGVRILHVFHTETKCNMHPSGCLYT